MQLCCRHSVPGLGRDRFETCLKYKIWNYCISPYPWSLYHTALARFNIQLLKYTFCPFQIYNSVANLKCCIMTLYMPSEHISLNLSSNLSRHLRRLVFWAKSEAGSVSHFVWFHAILLTNWMIMRVLVTLWTTMIIRQISCKSCCDGIESKMNWIGGFYQYQSPMIFNAVNLTFSNLIWCTICIY